MWFEASGSGLLLLALCRSKNCKMITCNPTFLFKGMRYKRRGVDTDGHVANYVETEQLIHVHNHTLSFVQTRGSVPVFWSQVGYRYNPRPRLEKGIVWMFSYVLCHDTIRPSVRWW